MSDTNSVGAGYDPYSGFDDILKKREQAGPANKSEPVPGIVHGAITGILGVDSSGTPANKASAPGLWSPDNPDVATPDFSIAGRDPRSFFPRTPPKKGPLVDDAPPKEFIWPAIQGPADDPKVQQDKQLSTFPTRTDTPENTPLNGGLPTPFGPGMGLANPGAPGAAPPATFPGAQPSSAPPQPAPQRVAPAPRPPVAQPSPAPVGPLQPGSVPPTSGPVAPVPSAPQADNSIIPSDSVLGRVLSGMNQWRNENRLTLLAMAGGLAGSQSWGQGLGRAFQAAVPAQQADIANNLAVNNANMTADLLMKNASKLGMPDMTREQAVGLARNPDVMKQILPQLFGQKQFEHVMGKDMFGGETPMSFDPRTGRYFDQSGRQVGGAASGGAGGIPGFGNGQAAAAPYSTQGRPTLNNFNMSMVNPNIKGWDYLKQYPVEVEDTARAMMEGGAMPTGNPRQQGITTVARTAAQKVAQDLGNPDLADDTLYAERRRVRTDLGASGNSSMGGIIANGKSSFAHLADLSDKYADLGNYSGPNIPGGAWAGRVGNVAGNVVGTTPRQAGKIKAAEDNALKYGQESTKFYAGSGGGEAERMTALKGVRPSTALGTEMASFLETEKGLMLDRLRQKEAQIRGTLGQDFLNRHPVMDKDLEEKIGRIDANISKLRGEAPGAGERGQGAPALIKQGEHTFRVYPDGRSELVK